MDGRPRDIQPVADLALGQAFLKMKEEDVAAALDETIGFPVQPLPGVLIGYAVFRGRRGVRRGQRSFREAVHIAFTVVGVNERASALEGAECAVSAAFPVVGLAASTETLRVLAGRSGHLVPGLPLVVGQGDGLAVDVDVETGFPGCVGVLAVSTHSVTPISRSIQTGTVHAAAPEDASWGLRLSSQGKRRKKLQRRWDPVSWAGDTL